MIALEHVSKHFQGRRRVTALEEINLEIPKGELVSIVGPSGSGKSTLLNLIGGLDRPTAGTITLDGRASTALRRRPDGVRRDSSDSSCSSSTCCGTSCLENVALPLHCGRARKKTEARARERSMS